MSDVSRVVFPADYNSKPGADAPTFIATPAGGGGGGGGFSPPPRNYCMVCFQTGAMRVQPAEARLPSASGSDLLLMKTLAARTGFMVIAKWRLTSFTRSHPCL